MLLFDEVESHLHPRWQRAIAPALLECARVLTGEAEAELQLIATTHSPLVLASLEPCFDEETDKLFTLERSGAWDFGVAPEDGVVVREQAWAKQGDAVNWLVSEAFGLRQARSLEAELAIEAAGAWMRGDRAELPAGLASRRRIHAELQRTLPGHDEFWPRWIVEGGPHGPSPRRPAAAARKVERAGRRAAGAGAKAAGAGAGKQAGPGAGKKKARAAETRRLVVLTPEKQMKLVGELAHHPVVIRMPAKQLERGRMPAKRLAGSRPLEERRAAARRPERIRGRQASGIRTSSRGVSGGRTVR